MNICKISCLMLASLFLFSSCATVFSKSNYDVVINSSPEGAKFVIHDKDDKQVSSGITPQSVRLKSSAGYFQRAQYEVRFTSQDGEEVKLPITFHVDGWYIVGNFIIGGLLGYLIIDPLSGAMFTIDEDVIKANLGGQKSAQNEPELRIMSLDEFQGDKDKLVRLN